MLAAQRHPNNFINILMKLVTYYLKNSAWERISYSKNISDEKKAGPRKCKLLNDLKV